MFGIKLDPPPPRRAFVRVARNQNITTRRYTMLIAE